MAHIRKKKKWLSLFFLHRYTGLTAAFFVIMLSITGILLNHTEEFELNKHKASASWLLSLYGIKAPKIDTVYLIKDDWIIEFGDSIYWNQKPLNCKPPLTGAYATKKILLISNASEICLFTPEVELIDSIVTNSNHTIKRLGEYAPMGVGVETTNGLYRIDADYTKLVSIKKDNPHIAWKKPVVSADIPTTLTTALTNAYKGAGLPWERVILDLHSGRIVGRLGVYFMDLVAILMIFLAITGVLMWLKPHVRRRR